VQETYNICWGGQAALQHFHGVPKYELPRKLFGVFPHNVCGGHDGLLRGFDDQIAVPVSRHTEVRREDLPEDAGLTILLESDEAGLCLIRDEARRQIYMFNHLEYDTYTLADEYHRDAAAGGDIQLPAHYFPGDDPTQAPINHWRAHANVFIGNWINDLYQSTSYELVDIPAPRR
jgi:homoserine O-succinyltransferase